MAGGAFGGLCENGHDVPPGARFCPACGSPAHAPSAEGLGGPRPPGYPNGPPGYPNRPAGPPAAPPGPLYGPPGYGPPARGPYGPPPNYYWAYTGPQTGTNGLAIASMVLGILWLWWLGSILAVVFGHVALHQIRRSGQGGRGMAIAGLVLGYLGLALAVVAIVAVGVAASSNPVGS